MLNKFFLVIFLGFAVFTRMWQLDALPPSLNWDEVSLGYNSYSILKTGKDEWGNLFPLSFRAYGDYKLPVYIYADIPFISVLGLNEWSVRLPSVLSGIGAALFIFLILREIGNKNLALWGAFLTIITPWSLILSRIALEANLALFLVTGFVYFLIKGLKRPNFYLIASVVLGLSLFTYNSARVVGPLLLILAILIFGKKIYVKNKPSWVALLIFIAFFSVALPIGLLQDSSARYKWTAILDEGAINRINELRGSSALPSTLSKLNYNKVTYFIPEAAKNYILHFNPSFLFLRGGSNYQFSVPESGLLYTLYLPFLIWGLIAIFRKKNKLWYFLLGWLLVAPIPVSLTRDSPHALRSLLMIPPLLMITSLGINNFLENLRYKKFLSVFIIITILISFGFFWKNYSEDYVRKYSWSWQYGYKQTVDFIRENGHNYEKIYITKKYGEPHEFLLLYLQYDPETYRKDPNLIRYKKSDWFWVDQFDKYVFLNDWEVKEVISRQPSVIRQLLVTSPGNYPEGSRLLETINFLDGIPAFDIVELQQVK